ncbi:hypothetical protein DB346_05485 [Verrucomicrobia bacterium LW23]|nr:hypothetical protein DB346_05485 [Verrucomicrobia bacterium LW23]
MKHRAIFDRQPWLITPEALQAIAAFSAWDEWDEEKPGDAQAPLYEVVDGVAVFPIMGALARTASWWADASMEDIGAAVKEAAGRADVRAILLDIDSPGGTVNGTPELAQIIADATRQKYVYAFTAGQMCSAAYWLASQCDAIYMTPSARVGSIGVILSVLDWSEMYKSWGIRVEVFAAGKYKSAGAPGTSLTDEQRAHLQGDIDEIAAEFDAAVLARGRQIPAEALEGQTFSGRGAQERNLAMVVKDRAEVLERLGVLGARPAIDSNAKAMTIEAQLKAANDKLAEIAAKEAAEEKEKDEAEETDKKAAEDDEEKKDGDDEEDDEEADAKAKSRIAALSSENALLKSQVAGLSDVNAKLVAAYNKLEARDKDLSARANREAARIVAETGTSTPARVSARSVGGQDIEALRAEFKAIKDPKAQSAFLARLTPDQFAAL